MLKELLELTYAPDYEENGGIAVVGVARPKNRDCLELFLEVNTGEDEIVQKWKLICRSECENNVVVGWGEKIEVANDHVLLWPYTKTVCSLWFSGSGEHALSVVGELWREHYKLVGDWFEFPHFLNSFNFVDLVSDGHGKLAEGPEPLIATYEQVMVKYGFKTSVTSRPPVRWNGAAWVKPGNLVALIVAKSRVIASSVEAHRIG